jgi:hypothetical protein
LFLFLYHVLGDHPRGNSAKRLTTPANFPRGNDYMIIVSALVSARTHTHIHTHTHTQAYIHIHVHVNVHTNTLLSEERPVRRADKFTAICEPIVYTVWDP